MPAAELLHVPKSSAEMWLFVNKTIDFATDFQVYRMFNYLVLFHCIKAVYFSLVCGFYIICSNSVYAHLIPW